MKKLLLTFIFCIAFSIINSSTFKSKLTFTYHSFRVAIGTPNNTYLIFSIKNNTSDTVYLSRENIKKKVIRSKNILSEEQTPKSTNLLCAFPFPPFFGSDEEYEGICTEEIAYQKKMDLIKNKYATKLYNKNFNPNTRNKIDKKGFIELIVNQCIILLPNQTINYATFFHHSKFDKTCKVTAYYLDNGIFTTYKNNDNNTFYIRY